MVVFDKVNSSDPHSRNSYESSLFEICSCISLTFAIILFSSCCLLVFIFSPRQIKANFKNPTGFIMTWLSVLDSVSGFVLLLPMAATVCLDHEWVFGRRLCAVQGVVLQLVQNMVNCLLMAVSLDRFLALVTPLR